MDARVTNMSKKEVDPVVKMRIRRLINKLGGAAMVSDYIGATRGSINVWPFGGRIPPQWRPAIKRVADDLRVELLKVEQDLLKMP